MSKQNYFLELKKIDADDSWFESLEMLNDYFDDLLENKEYAKCDSEMVEFMKYDFSYRLHLSLLTVTYRRRNRLNRKNILDKARELAVKKGFTEEQINLSINRLQ